MSYLLVYKINKLIMCTMENQQITMTIMESERYDIVKQLINKEINGTQAARKLGLSVRQIKRIKKRVLKYGIEGVIHKSRGKVSNRKLDDCIKKEIISIIENNYHDFSSQMTFEKLNEIHNIKVSYPTVRRIRISEGFSKIKKRKINKKHYSQRPRKEYYGELEQFDGSYHNWLEGRCTDEGLEKEQCLLLAVDDATSRPTHAKLAKNESTYEVFTFWKEYLKKCGKPLNIYLDRFSTYKINHKNAKDNKELKTQFERGMTELDINVIFANSAQAKGRVERMNGTFQDRLIKEMRLAGINNVKDANEFIEKFFIPMFNKKFSVVPKKQGDIHKKLIEDTEHMLCIKNQRIVRNDFVVQYKNRYFQLDEIQPTTVYKKDKLIIEEHKNEIYITKKDKYLNFKELHEKPVKEISLKLPAITTYKSTYKPPANHPWRMYSINNNQRIKN